MARWTGRLFALAALVVAAPACHKTTVTEPTLTATCGASPTTGTAPLTVAFTLNVAGAQGTFSVAISYGDGTQGSDPGSTHVYATAGTYSPAMTVSTSTQSTHCSAVVTVAAPTPTPTPPTVNLPPHPVFHTNPDQTAGKAPFTVEFNLCQSTDPEGDRLFYKMDLDGDGVYEYLGSTGADCRHTRTYAAGTYVATICVTDVNCPAWPDCFNLPPNHPYQCKSYSVISNP